eukprot:PLAT9207.4.p3 GENE.PLAT9207.4~~PLAT9207.4.p3  ORF type:complete len:399 (+),score=180.19 PLAT9207.4:33-1199(+)
MPESTVVCMDTSEWMRNGDYIPTRFEAQRDAVNMVCGVKTQENPENTVGVLTMAGKRVQVRCPPTTDMGKILAAVHSATLGGSCQFAAGLAVAKLALAHRKNKVGGQRIIAFIGSPIEATERELARLGKQLKRVNIAVDVVSMGEVEGNAVKLEALLKAVNSGDNSHVVEVPAGVLPSDVIASSPIIGGGGMGGMGMGMAGGAGGGGGGGGMPFAEYGGVNPELEPDLAAVLAASMEEHRVRLEGEGAAEGLAGMSEEERMLQEALALSMADAPAGAVGGDDGEDDIVAETPEAGAAADAAAAAAAADAATADKSGADDAAAAAADGAAAGAGFLDPSFMSSVIAGLDGVDPSDPAILAAMSEIAGGSSDPADEPTDDKKDSESKKDK